MPSNNKRDASVERHRPPTPFYESSAILGWMDSNSSTPSDGPRQYFPNCPPVQNSTTNSPTAIDHDGAANRHTSDDNDGESEPDAMGSMGSMANEYNEYSIPDPFAAVLIATTDEHIRVYSSDYSHRPIYLVPMSQYVSEFPELPGYCVRLISLPTSTAAPVDSSPEPETAEDGVTQDDPVLDTLVQPPDTPRETLLHAAILLLVIFAFAHL